MALTQDQRNVWLSEDFHRIVLADIQYHDGTDLSTLHFSSYPYVMPIDDTTIDPIDGVTVLSNIIYDDIIATVPNIVTRIDQDSTIGAIDLLNTDGEYDYLLYDVTIVGHPIRLFIGDTGWPRDNYIQILDGIVNSVSSSAPENIRITLRDRKETLNVPLQTDLFTEELGGIWATLMDAFASTLPAGLIQGSRAYSRALAVLPEDIKNTHIPVCLGKCFNIEPVLVDSWNHVYMIHTSNDITIDSLVEVSEVRTNGIPLLPQLTRKMVLPGGVGTFVINDVITDDTNAAIWGTIYDVEGVSPTQTLYYVINDPANDFASGTGTFTGSISGALGVASNPTDISQYEVDLASGLLRLLDHPSGTQITCDVIAQAERSSLVPPGALYLEPYSVAWIIEWILLEKANTPFDDICQFTFPPPPPAPGENTNYPAFDNISHMGIYYKDETTVLETITKVANSVGGFLRFKDEFCKLQLYKLNDPALEDPANISLYLGDDEIVENGISIAAVEEPKKSITLGYRKNWKTQDEGSLAYALTDIDSPYYNMELLDSFKNNYTSLYELTGISETEYPLAQDVDLIETTIYETADAQAELDRRITLRTPRRRVIRIQSLATSFTYDIGDLVNVTNSRFGLRSGKQAVIIGVEESPTSKRVTLDVWL